MNTRLFVATGVLMLAALGCQQDATSPTWPAPTTTRADANPALSRTQASGKSTAPSKVPALHGGKVAVCHRTGRGAFVRIEVAAPALSAHLAHGDKLAGVGEACIATRTSLAPVADGIVRDGSIVVDGSVVQVLHIPSFEDRGIIEFNISNLSGPVSQAALTLSVYAGNGPYPFTIDAFAYSGDGVLAVDDWDRGSLFTSFQYAGEATVTLNVTAPLRALVSSGATFTGFNFRFSVPSPINDNGPFVAFRSMELPPAAVLTVTAQGSP